MHPAWWIRSKMEPDVTRKILIAVFGIFLAMMFAVGPANAQTSGARIHLIHGIPGANVDVVVGGDVVFSNFAFKDTQDLSSFAGKTLTGLKVNAAGTSDTLIDAGDVALPATGNYTVFAHLDADGKPALAVFQNDTATLAAGKGRLIVRHAAAPAVDVKANGAVAFTNLANGKEGKADLDAGTVKAEVVPTGASTPVVIGPVDLPIAEGSALIVYATGALDAGLQVVTETITGLGPNPTAVQTGDSPVDQGAGAASTLLIAAGAAAVALGGGGLASLALRRVRA